MRQESLISHISCLTSHAYIQQCCRGELGTTGGTNRDRTESEEHDASFNDDLDDARPPCAIDATRTVREHSAVRSRKASRFGDRSARCAKGPERHGCGSESGGIGRSRCLESRREDDSGVRYTECQHEHKTGDRQKQNRCRSPLASHLSTRMTAFAVISTPTPPKNGAATRYGNVTRTSARRPTTSGLRTDT